MQYMHIYPLSRKKRGGFLGGLRGRNLSYAHYLLHQVLIPSNRVPVVEYRVWRLSPYMKNVLLALVVPILAACSTQQAQQSPHEPTQMLAVTRQQPTPTSFPTRSDQ